MNERMCTSKTAEIEALAVSSNNLLSDANQSVIRELLREAEGNIKLLDQEISQLKTVISTLEGQRAENFARIKKLHIGIAPHRKIPTEILTKIFAYNLGGQVLPLPPRSDGPIWNILRVCSRWRWVAIAEPLFWSHIKAADLRDREALNLLLHDIFANRGRGCLITYQAPLVNNTRAWENLSSLLRAYPSRLRHIDIAFRNFLPPLVNEPSIKLDCLESVDISFQCWFTNQESAPVVDFFTSETLRKVVMLSGYRTSPPSQWLNRVLLPWAQLTDLDLENVPLSAMGTILGQCVCLSECTIGLGASFMEQNISLNPILLEHLQSLSFCHLSDFESTVHLLNVITVPALTYLSFEIHSWSRWPYESVLNLVSRSACSLEVLITPSPSVDEWQIVPMMRAMPDLTELHLFTNAFIADSTVDVIRRENLAPRLRILYGPRLASLRPFVELLESRCGGEGDGGIHKASVELENLNRDHDYYENVYPRLDQRGVYLEVIA